MAYPLRANPILRQEHVANARLYADRNDMVQALGQSMQAGTIAEIGVARGDFSAILLEAFRPRSFVAFDLFTMHDWPAIWGKPPRELLGDKTHPDFYRDRFRDYPVTLEIGKSADTLAKYPDADFDLIYIDADHEYEGVLLDANLSKRKLKRDGILIFNDYIMYDHIADVPYGVIPVVNTLVVEEGWEVIGFALQQYMFCDIALRRRPDALS